jgi:hypothetical protein
MAAICAANRSSNASGCFEGLCSLQSSNADHFERAGMDLFKAACERDLEGIVAKLATGRYEPEATSWVKIKNPTYSQAEGRADFFDIRTARQPR